MDLLEREGPLAALADARRAAGEGIGSVVLVSGEPGIGKTALVTRFVHDLEDNERVLWGTCDNLSIPRPLGPFRDLVGGVSSGLAHALTTDVPIHDLHRLLLEEMELPPRPTVLVLEDVHWADEATIDAITFLGRRIGQLPALLILTFRRGELDPGHPLHGALGAIRAETSLYLQLAPLSQEAVARLAGPDSDRVYAATEGNPFFVTEMISSLPTELAPSVANAVLGRASKLSETSQRLVELVSMVPNRIPTNLLDMVMPDWPPAAEEPERRQLLHVSPRHVRFRHELARLSIRSSVPAARRRRLHAEIVRALLESKADAAEIVHHAEEAGDLEVVADHALIAARHAAAVESNREAYAHYQRASQFADRLEPHVQAGLFEDYAWTAYLVGHLDDALVAVRRAIDLYGEIGDAAARGRCTRILSRIHWYAGDGEEAWMQAQAAIRILEPLGESEELARALSGLSQLAMLSARLEEAMQWGRRAADLAGRLGAEGVKAHSMINIGLARAQRDPDDLAALKEGVTVAEAAAEHHEVVRGLIGLAFMDLVAVKPESALRHTEQGRSYAEEHQVDTLLSYLNVILARLRLRSGDWNEAGRLAEEEAAKGMSVSQLMARTVLTQLAIRRGDPDATDRLAELVEDADRTGEIQRIGPVFELEVELALLRGHDLPVARVDVIVAEVGQEAIATGLEAVRLAGWAALIGVSLDTVGQTPRPHACMTKRDWKGAADAFGAVEWDYDRALMLSLLDDEVALGEALDIARRLGAGPLVDRVMRRMRALGQSVPSRPREATLANPAGLTSRQLEVLELLSEGMTNAEIAGRLFVSPRTAEHHVEAIFAKLGVSTRREAAQRYGELMIADSRR